MDKIKKIINKLSDPDLFLSRIQSINKLKRLIELVEDEQVKECSCSFKGWDGENFPTSNEIMKSKRVSEQIDWEEL